ncbi:protein DEK isoform X2 [Engraulis encrasicolus]|uniref:protein DEK isoform X2 n=1 Tax=Engraulis encrasicolus TaxID=184585 RepID=UPI002FD00045
MSDDERAPMELSDDDAQEEEKTPLFNAGEILEGKRETKKVERLVQATQFAKPKERLKVEIGGGDKLGEIARINHNIGKTKAVLLKPLHKVLFDRPGAAANMKKNLRLFSGFPFQADSDLYSRKIKVLTKYPNSMLKSICQVLDIERSGNHIVLVERIMGFLMSPVNTGKPVAVKKKKKKRKNTSASDGKKKASKVVKSPKKATVEGKSKAIVTDSSSDDDDEDDDSDDDKPTAKDTKTSSAPESRKKKDSDDSDSEEDEEEVEEDEEEDDDDFVDKPPKSKPPPKKKPATPKKAASKKPAKTTPAKKKPVSKKVVKDEESGSTDKSDSDGSDNDDGSDFEKPKKKPAAKKQQAKPAPKTKKADSSSNKAAKKRQVLQDSDDSSDDDTPLIKMIKKPPSDEQIKTLVQELLKDANLEEVTMKQLCQKVYDAYPEFDLTSRKDYIKQTVKSLIS